MAQTVAETLVGVLEHIGVKQIFALIGDSLNPLADAVRRSSSEWIGVRHEEGAALAASGQAKLTGRLAVCAGTTGPGKLAVDGSAIVDAVVAANELPNLPHLDLELLGAGGARQDQRGGAGRYGR
jgi:thiamine pyrophosphate-dependent acetolactate synthase large subunit-like protein